MIKSKFPKVLIYNWLPFDNPWNWGGGVTVYCRNIIAEMLKSNPELNVYFLSSGFSYDASTTEIFVRKINNMFGDRVHFYEIVNSPVPADQRNLYINPFVALENQEFKKVVSDFIERYGSFEAIHFNNIEGLSLDVFDLKKVFPNTRFIFSIHNYIPVCLNGFYYMRHKHCNCSPEHTAEDCFITDSFHGTAFSIIFNKPFLAIANQSRGATRFGELLGKFNLTDRLAMDSKNIPQDAKLLEAIDYTQTNEIIKSERDRSIQWLKRALEVPLKSNGSPSLPVSVALDPDTKRCRISIMGSCVSRDIFSTHENDGDYKFDRYAYAISPISAVSRPPMDIDYMEVLNLFSDISWTNFTKRNWVIDLTGSAFKYLSSETSDYLLLDMNSCKFNYYHFQEGFLTKPILDTQKEKEMFSLFFLNMVFR